jgi:hypothetical protein
MMKRKVKRRKRREEIRVWKLLPKSKNIEELLLRMILMSIVEKFSTNQFTLVLPVRNKELHL